MKQWDILHKKNPGKEEVIKILLENRGIKTKKEIEDFLSPILESITINSVGIEADEIHRTLQIIDSVINSEKQIVIYGDYDVDGITGTAILWESIFSFYKNVHPYIPHRQDEGYGISVIGIDNILDQIKNVGLIITVDNGIVAYDAISYAKEKGVEVVVTDHHAKGYKKPDSVAIVHTTNLCGASVAYLLADVLLRKYNSEYPHKEKHLELAALATVADLVALNKYNRTILKHGLTHLRNTKRIGLQAIYQEAKIATDIISPYVIGHVIAPRLNASGRISHALDALRLICTTDKTRAKNLAMQLGEINKQRQQLTIDSAEFAIQELSQNQDEEKLLFIANEEFEQGVIGLIASRVVEKFYKPTIAVSVGLEISKGSARSIKGVNIIELIRSVPEFLKEAGGHPMAAGFSVETKKLPSFKKALQKKAQDLDAVLFQRKLLIDCEIDFSLIDADFYEEIKKLEPFGMGNPTPVFISKRLNIMSMQYVGRESSHLQLVLEQDGFVFKAMLFNYNKENVPKIGDILDVVYTIEENIWREKRTLELRIKDFKSVI